MEKFINADALKLKFSVESTEAISERATDDTFVAFCKGVEKIALRTIDEMQPADVQEVKHGKWNCYYDSIDNYFGETGADIYCSVCCCKVNICTDYCPNCGARMDGDVK